MTTRKGQTVHESRLVGGTSTALPDGPQPATTNTYRRFKQIPEEYEQAYYDLQIGLLPADAADKTAA